MSKMEKSYTRDERSSYSSFHISSFAHMILTAVYLILLASFDRFAVVPLLALVSYPLFMVLAYGLDYVPIAKRILFISPFVIFLGIWNVVYDNGSVLFLNFPIPLGIVSFLALILKLVLSVSSVLILISLAGFAELTRALSAMGVPDVVVTQLVLLNRYIYLIGEEIKNVLRARLLRGGAVDIANAGSVCGALLLRSISRACRVGMALECRCFGGRLYGNSAMIKFSSSDKLFVVCWLIFFAFVRFVETF